METAGDAGTQGANICSAVQNVPAAAADLTFTLSYTYLDAEKISAADVSQRERKAPTMAEAFLCDAVRTPIGRYAGALAKVRTDDLAAVPLKALMARSDAKGLANFVPWLGLNSHWSLALAYTGGVAQHPVLER